MPYSYTIEERIVHLCWSGAISQADLDSFGEEMPRIGRRLGFAPDVLHTFVGVMTGLRPMVAFMYSQRHRQEPIPNPIRAAIVTTTEECEALATVIKSLDATPNLEMKVFHAEAEARRWLARQ